MPTVPVIQESRVQTRALPDVQVRGQQVQAPQSLGAVPRLPDTSNAFSKTKAAFSELAQQAKQRADKTALTEAQSTIDAWELDNLYGKDGALNTKGKAAFNLPSKFGVNYNEALSNARSMLHNDDQKFAFDQWAMGRKVSVRKSLLQHEASEFNRYSMTQNEAGVELARQRAIASGNPRDIAEAESHMLDLIDTNIGGMPDEYVALKRMEATTKLYTGVIDNLVDRDITQAKAYFKANSDKIDPTLHDDIKKKLETGSVKQDALERSDKILMEHESYEDQVAEARKITDQKTRDAVLSRIDSNYSREQRVKAANKENVDESLTEFLTAEEPLSFDQLPVDLQLRATEADERRYKRAYDKLTGNEKFDEDETLDLYDRVMTAYELDPATIMETPRTEIMQMKPGKERDELLEKRREYLAKGYEAPEAGASEFNEIISLYTENILELNPKNSAGKKTIRDFRNAMRIQAQAFEQKNDRKPSYEELQKMADRQVESVTLQEGYIYDVKSPRFQIDPEDIDLGDAERDAVIWALQQNGYGLGQITDSLITDAAYKYIKKGGTLNDLVREYKNAGK